LSLDPNNAFLERIVRVQEPCLTHDVKLRAHNASGAAQRLDRATRSAAQRNAARRNVCTHYAQGAHYTTRYVKRKERSA